MGLDLVEFVIAVEEYFGVAIPDSVAERLTTPRALVDYLVATVPASDDGPSLLQRAFYSARKALSEATGVPLRTVKPGTDLAELIAGDRHLWEAVRARAGE